MSLTPENQPGKTSMIDLANRANPLVDGNAARDFKPRSDLTYHSYAGARVDSVSLQGSLLIGSSFQHCVFVNVQFDNCDIEGARFMDCAFSDCTFIDADLRSCTFTRCTVETCSFSQALLLDVTVQASRLWRTDFERASIHESMFERSTLCECSLKHASALHNTFDRTSFKDIRIANCTFLYALMLNCQFDDVELNAEAVGTIFGMSLEDLASMTLIYLGETQPNPSEDIVAALKSSYIDRKWYFLCAMLEVSFGPAHRLNALNQALSALCAVASAGLGVKRDEFRFLARVAEEFGHQNTLPVSFLVRAAEETGRLLTQPDVSSNVSSTIQELHNRLYLLLQQSVDLYTKAVEQLLPEDNQAATVQVTLVYRERPVLDSAEVIRLAGHLMSIETLGATLLSAKQGSWIEIIKTTAQGAMAFYAIIVATNGILAQIIRTRALANALTLPIPKRTVQALVRTTVLRSNESVPNRVVRSALTTLSDMTKRSDSADAVQQRVAGGLDKLESVTVEFDESPKKGA